MACVKWETEDSKRHGFESCRDSSAGKHLLQEHEDLSLNPKHPLETKTQAYLHVPLLPQHCRRETRFTAFLRVQGALPK